MSKMKRMNAVSYTHLDVYKRQDNYNADAAIKNPNTAGKYRESIGVVFPDHQDKNLVLFGSKFGIAKGDLVTKKWEYLMLYSECKDLDKERAMRLRSNDGNVSPCGNYIYIGLMDDNDVELKNEGCLMRISLVNKTMEVVWKNITIPNAIHWSLDKKSMYVTDSLSWIIWKCDAQDLDKKVKLIDIKNANNQAFASPEPDGSDVDSENNILYTAVWSTHKVQAFDSVSYTHLDVYKRQEI